MTKTPQFLAVLCTAVAMPAVGHTFFELPSKMALSLVKITSPSFHAMTRKGMGINPNLCSILIALRISL